MSLAPDEITGKSRDTVTKKCIFLFSFHGQYYGLDLRVTFDAEIYSPVAVAK